MAKGIKSAVLCMMSALLMFFSSALLATNVIQLTVHGFIGPATKDYLIRGIASAEVSDLVLIKINSFSGLIESTHDIVQSILNAKAPVVTFISPQGAGVSGAGTFILYASTVAAMADGSTLGTGGPLQMTKEGGQLLNELEPYIPLTKEQRAMNVEYSYLHSLPALRGRHSLFDEFAVRNSTTMTAADALQSKVINFIAVDESDLIKQLNGYYVAQNGAQLQLYTTAAKLVVIQPDWRMRLLRVITEPTVAYLLLLFGVYGIVFELMLPRKYLPGIMGGIAVLLGLYALTLLPINFSGLGFIFLGLAFVLGEFYSPSHGLLAILGTIAFVWGSKVLINTDHQDFQIYGYTVWIMASLNVLVFMVLFRMMKKARQLSPMHGVSMLIGAHGRTITPVNLEGQAIIHGEIWNVQSNQTIDIDKTIKVVSVDGLRLGVEREGD